MGIYKIKVNVEGEIELTVKASCEKTAKTIAKRVVERAHIARGTWKNKHLEEVTETLEYEVADD